MRAQREKATAQHQRELETLESQEQQSTQKLTARISDLEQTLDGVKEEADSAREVGVEADRRRLELAEAVESSKFWADKEIQKLKQVVVTLKRSLDKERSARKTAELAAEDERKRAHRARTAAEPRIAAWRAAQEDADPETEVEIEE